MLTRRHFVATSAAFSGAALALGGCGDAGEAPTYSQLVETTWRHSKNMTPESTIDLVRYATLAANSHNTQPWKFAVSDDRISIGPDLTRRCPAVDDDNHHLYASLGCAAENLVQAARAMGRHADIGFRDGDLPSVEIALSAGPQARSDLFEAIPKRQCTRAEYDGRAVLSEQLDLLREAASGPNVDMLLVTDTAKIKDIADYVVAGNTAQMADKAFVEELKAWIRFSEAEVASKRDGVFSASSGNPTLPRWLGSFMFDWLFTAEAENEKYLAHIKSSAGIAVFASAADDPAHWVEAGRSYQRFALQATALGLKHAFVNQPVEVASVRPELTRYLGLGDRRPDLVVRFGYGPELPRSLRRPVDQVIA